MSGWAGEPVASINVTWVSASLIFDGRLQDHSKLLAATIISSSTTANSLFIVKPLLNQAIVFFQDGAQLVVRQRDDSVIFDAGGGFRGDHGVDDGLFRGLDGGREDRVDSVVGEHFQREFLFANLRMRIGGGESDEDVARTVAGNAAVAAESKGNAASQAFQLMGKKRCISGHDHDDRAAIDFLEGSRGVGGIFRNFSSDRYSSDTEIGTDAVVALNENTDSVAAIPGVQFARRAA